MENGIYIDYIARIHTDFATKFGVPRQSGLVPELRSSIVFEPQFRNPDALRGIEDFSHIWLIWHFSEADRESWSPTVRPPRLGGNRRLGVFATRSPFRPNSLALSCVKLESVELSRTNGPVLHVSGADLMDGTPIFDIKPYIPYADCRPEASGGFTDEVERRCLTVVIPDGLRTALPPEKLASLTGVLENDPRPSYQDDPERVYGFGFAGAEVRFRVSGEVLTVVSIEK